MPYPLYTNAECEAAIVAIDAEVTRLRKLAQSFAVGGGRSFSYQTKIHDLLLERNIWLARQDMAGGTVSPAQIDVELT